VTRTIPLDRSIVRSLRRIIASAMSVTWNSSRKRTVVDCASRVVRTGKGSACGFCIFSICACLPSQSYELARKGGGGLVHV
jgi:hypothetical protein